MKRLFFGVLGLVGLVFIAIIGIAVFIPPEDVKTEIVRQLRKNSGWNLRIDGDIDIGVWPNINLAAKDVGLSGKAWADGLEFVSADDVSFGLAILPLLTGNVEVSTIRFENPVFELEIDRNGQTSWDPVDIEESKRKPTSIEDAIGQPSGGANSDGANSQPESENAQNNAEESASGSTLPIQNIRVSSFEVINGTLSYLDRRTGESQIVEEVNVTASVPSLDSRSKVDGSLVWRGQSIKIKASIEQLRALLEKTVSDIAVEVETGKGAVSLEGQVSSGGDINFNGKVAGSIPSLPGLLAWATGVGGRSS